MEYKDDFMFPPSVSNLNGLELSTIYPSHLALKLRREQIGLTQQEVADNAKIALRQYQRFESGVRSMSSASFRIGLSICHVLKLDPARFVTIPDSD